MTSEVGLAFQIRAVPSRLDVTIRLPSGVNATPRRSVVGPASVNNSLPEAKSQTFAAPIPACGGDAAAVGAERHAAHPVRVARQHKQLSAGLRVPNPRGLIPTAGDKSLPVGAEGDSFDSVGMPVQG